MARPTSDEGWTALRNEINQAFSPGSPIKVLTELAGRDEQRRRLSDIVLRAGEHVIIFGERGVGKTSLARTFHAPLNTDTRRVNEIAINCVEEDSFYTIWRRVFRRVAHSNGEASLEQIYKDDITPDDILIELGGFSANDLPLVIFDEFDRVSDERTKKLMTDTIKLLSDEGSHVKILLVGIADDVGELVARHKSISRNLKQVQMPRLNLSESEGIVRSRVRSCGMSIEEEASFLIAYLSRGLPYFSHLVGQYAALDAIEKRHMNVTEENVYNGLTAALQDVDQTITEAYLQAIVSQRPDETLYEPVLMACALADADELGRFQQAAVTHPLSEIVDRMPPYTPTTFAFHMNEFCEPKRGAVLSRTGEARNLRYFFSDPMMQPYVLLRGLESGKINIGMIEKFMPKRQRKLSIDP